MKFTKNTIMLDIAKRMGDNELKLYKYRGWSAFQNTLATLAADRTAWERQEISPLLKTKTINMVFEDAAFKFSLPSDAIAFTDIWIDPTIASSWGGILKRIDEADAQRASTGEIAFMPAGNEVFWYLVGDEFRFILSIDMYSKVEGAVAEKGTVLLEYVSDPSTLDFEKSIDEDELSTYTGFEQPLDGLPDLVDWFGFSSRFLYRCINDSVLMLVADNQVARPEEKAIDIETNPPEMGAV
jgi:hypothetical protein